MILCHQENTAEHGGCVNCSQRKHTLFSELEENELNLLNSERYSVNYKKDEVIYKAGTMALGLICLHNGKVKIMRTGPAGNDQIVSLRKEGEFIGLRAMLKNSIYSSSAIAIEDSSICVIPKDVFLKVLLNNPDLGLKITSHFIGKLDEAENMYINHSQKHMRARLADALIKISEVYGVNPANGYLQVQLKRAEIAALANMTTANAIRVLSSFNAENLVELHKKDIKMVNIPALKFLSMSG